MESKKFFIKNKQILWWGTPFLAALAVVLPLLLKEGIPFGNDASFHLSRVVSIAEGLKNGIFLPGVYADYFNGYGYGNGLFYPDFFLYIPSVLSLLGMDAGKLFKRDFINVSTLRPGDVLVTDAEADKEMIKHYEEMGLTVIIAE